MTPAVDIRNRSGGTVPLCALESHGPWRPPETTKPLFSKQLAGASGRPGWSTLINAVGLTYVQVLAISALRDTFVLKDLAEAEAVA